jgi:aryl-alcohol dehydrogenase-like predicted oxidoreductase
MTMTPKEKTTLQEIFFDLCDLIDSGEIDDIAISEFSEFETLREFLIEQRTKLHPFTIEEEQDA